MKRIISLALCFLLVFALCQPAFAAGKGYEWTGASDNNWHTAENWIPEGVPESGDFVTIPTSAVVECDLGEEGGTLSLYLTCAGELTFPNGTLELHNSTLTGGKLSGAGTIVVTAIEQFQWTGGSIEGPGELHVQQGIFSVKPSAYLDRKLVLYGVNGKVLLSDSLTLAGGAEVGDISNNTITIHAGQTLELTGDNTTYSLVNCNNSGTLRISNTCQSVVFDGDFTQQSTGTLEFDVRGPGDFTKLEVGKDATLYGVLKINFLDDYVPSTDDRFEVITYGKKYHQFSSIVSNVGSIALEPTYTSKSLTLTVRELITTPSAPRNLAANWLEPEDMGGAESVTYDVSSDGGETWHVTGLTDTTYTFEDLTNGVEYTFAVRAVNSKGPGAAASATATPVGPEFAGGSGTEEDPYLVSSVYHLNNVRNHLNKHLKLTADLDLSAYGSDEGWEPIGTNTAPFTGTFDGNGHTIRNLVIDRPGDPHIGLFGYTGQTAKILNLGLVDVNVFGNHDVGGLVGWNYGVISNSYVTGTVEGRGETGGLVGTNYGTIVGSWAEGTVEDYWSGTTGGLVGENYGTVANCHANATVTTTSTLAGGLVAQNYGDIYGSYATGNVTGTRYVGGLVGRNSGGSEYGTGTIERCYATGNATGTEEWHMDYTYVGGLVGYNMGLVNNSYARGAASGPEDVGGLVGLNGEIASITNCYSTGRPSGDLNIGGLVGYGNPNGTVTDCYWDMTTSEIGDSAAGTGKNTDQMKQQATYENWDFDEVWCIDSNLNDGYPILRWQIPCDPCEIVETGEKYPSLGAALGAVASGQTIKLNTNITHTSPIEVNGKTINLELGNYSLLLDTSNHPDESIEYVLSVKNGGKVNLAGTGMGKFNVESSTHGYGVQVLGAGSEVTVNNVDVSWEYATAVYMYGSGDSLDGGSVTVNGNITAGYRGVTVNAKDGTVVVNGNITAGHTGVETWANPGTSVTVNGDITVTGTGASGAGVFALGQTLVTVTGNVEVQGTNCTGVHAKGGTIEVQGDVTSSGVGAKAETNYDYQDRYGQVTIHGTLSAQGPFIVIGSTEKTAADITEPTTKAGFLTYTDGNNTVWVASTGSTVPSEPQNLTATPDDGQVTLSWSAPDSNGGSAITKYQVSRDNGTSWTDVDKDILTYTFTGLTNGTPYTFLVRAVNIIGAGPAASVTATPQAVPVVTHTVNFYSDGVLHASKTVTSGDPLGANWPADPTRLGYSFAGWFTGQDGTGTQYTSASIITADVDLYAKWTQIIVSPGDDEVSIPPTPTYQADVVTESGSVTKLPVTVDRNAGTATVDAGSQDLDEEGAAITIPPIPDVDTYSVDIPVSKLSTPDLQETLTVNTDVGSITIPSNMLTGTESVDGTKAQISIGEGDKSTLPEDVRAAVGDKPLIRLTLAIDGKQTDWNNPNAPVTVSIPYTPTAEELANPEGIVAWYIDGSGNVVTIPNGRYDPETGMVTFTTTHFSNFAVAYNPVSFNDVPSDAWYHKAVSFIASRGVTSGTGDGNYSPEAKLTRGDFMVLLMRAYGIAPDTSPTDNFADAGDTYYTGYLAAAKRLGISQGVGDNMYAPGKDITRQEMFTLLYNALKVIARLPQGDSGKTLMDFSDASEIAPWAEEAMGHLVESGIVAGSEGRLNPAGTTTRAEMAQVLYNLLGK